jgi:LuxR family maltose regulon positive regulatory protein
VLNEAATLGQASGNVHLDVTATCTLGFVQMLRGQLHLAVESFDRAFEIGMAGGKLLTLFVGLAHAGMAEILYEWNDLDGAVRHSEEGIALGERGESVDVLGVGYSYVTLAQLHQAQGDEAKALRALQKGEQLARRCSQTHVSAVVAASRARLWLAQGSLAEASRWARAVCSTPSDEPEHRRLLEKIGVSRVRIAEGNPGEALDLLARLREVAEVMGRMDHLLQILNVQALAYQALGNGDQALSILQRALFLAEPEGYVRTFVDEGEPMARLLRRALTEGIAPSYVGKLVSAFRASAPTAPPAAQVAAGQTLVDPLTGRELQVLRLIAAGLSNREIAGELVVAVSTVKTHINHIYGKLDVKSRIQAVAKAQELGLL